MNFWTIILALFCYETVKGVLYAIIKVLSAHLKWVDNKHTVDEYDEEHIPLYTGKKHHKYDIEEAVKPKRNMIGFGNDD